MAFKFSILLGSIIKGVIPTIYFNLTHIFLSPKIIDKNITINPKEIKFSTSQPPLASTNPTLELANKFAPKMLIAFRPCKRSLYSEFMAFSINVPPLQLKAQPIPTSTKLTQNPQKLTLKSATKTAIK